MKHKIVNENNLLFWILRMILRIIFFFHLVSHKRNQVSNVGGNKYLFFEFKKEILGLSFTFRICSYYSIFIFKLVTYGNFMSHIYEMSILTWSILNRNVNERKERPLYSLTKGKKPKVNKWSIPIPQSMWRLKSREVVVLI